MCRPGTGHIRYSPGERVIVCRGQVSYPDPSVAGLLPAARGTSLLDRLSSSAGVMGGVAAYRLHGFPAVTGLMLAQGHFRISEVQRPGGRAAPKFLSSGLG